MTLTGNVTHTSVLPAGMIQWFDRLLLIRTAPKLCDDDEDLLNILAHIEEKLWKKLDKMPAKKLKCEKLRKEFKEIYEKIQKKKDSQTKAENSRKMSFYMFRSTGRHRYKLLFRLKRRARNLFIFRKYHDISKIQKSES